VAEWGIAMTNPDQAQLLTLLDLAQASAIGAAVGADFEDGITQAVGADFEDNVTDGVAADLAPSLAADLVRSERSSASISADLAPA
jgi:hypothetical protein